MGYIYILRVQFGYVFWCLEPSLRQWRIVGMAEGLPSGGHSWYLMGSGSFLHFFLTVNCRLNRMDGEANIPC